jgi:very-short-patch-repair endonuclease
MVGMEPTDHLDALAQRQHGLLHRRQIRAAGRSRSAIDHAVRIGRWQRMPGGVLRIAGSVPDDRQTAMACILAAGEGTVLSHSAGAALWGLPGFRLAPAHATRLRTSGRRTTARDGLHDTTCLPPHHVTEIDGIPVLTPSRLLFQLASTIRYERIARLTDKAWARRLVSGRSLHEMCDELSEHGRDGMAVMRQVLEARPIGYVPPESNLEARMEEIMRDHDLPRMRRQVDLGGREWLGRVDFLAVDGPLIVFVDGEHWHSSVLDRAADARQQAELELAGFVVVRISEYEVWHDVPAAVARIRAAWRHARHRAG